MYYNFQNIQSLLWCYTKCDVYDQVTSVNIIPGINKILADRVGLRWVLQASSRLCAMLRFSTKETSNRFFFSLEYVIIAVVGGLGSLLLFGSFWATCIYLFIICCCTCNGHLSVKGFEARLYIAEGTVIKSVRPPRYEVTESVARLLAVASWVVACRPTLVRSKGGYTGGASSEWNEPRPTNNIIKYP